jgi:hypothetical protein
LARGRLHPRPTRSRARGLRSRPTFAHFATSAITISNEQRSHWEAELIAQAQISARNNALDSLCANIEKASLIALDMNREHTTFRQLFPEGLRAVTRLGLESQIKEVRPWPTVLDSEPLTLTDLSTSLSDCRKDQRACGVEGDRCILA